MKNIFRNKLNLFVKLLFVTLSIFVITIVFYFSKYLSEGNSFFPNSNSKKSSNTFLDSNGNYTISSFTSVVNESKHLLLDYDNNSLVFNDSQTTYLENDELKKVIIHFWASWCEPCVNELPELIEYAKLSKGNSIKIYLISLDYDFESLEKFKKLFPEMNNKKLFVQIWDKESILSKPLSIEKLPVTFISNDKIILKKTEGVFDWKRLN